MAREPSRAAGPPVAADGCDLAAPPADGHDPAARQAERLIPILTAAARGLADDGGPSDPRREALLCLMECTVRACTAFVVASRNDREGARAALLEALSAARAAVTCAWCAAVGEFPERPSGVDGPDSGNGFG